MRNMRQSDALIQAIREHDPSKVKALLEAGVDSNAHTPALGVWRRRLLRSQMRVGMVRGGVLDPMAVEAAFKLVRPDPDPAIVLTVSESMPEDDAVAIIESLLDYGADPDIPDNLGNTALIQAANNGKLKLVDTLLTRGADVNRKNNAGHTALIVAPSSVGHEVVRRLLQSKPDLNLQDNFGTSALMAACYSPSDHPIVKLLLDAGANPHLKNGNGKDALAIAREHHCENTVRLLLAAEFV